SRFLKKRCLNCEHQITSQFSRISSYRQDKIVSREGIFCAKSRVMLLSQGLADRIFMSARTSEGTPCYRPHLYTSPVWHGSHTGASFYSPSRSCIFCGGSIAIATFSSETSASGSPARKW